MSAISHIGDSFSQNPRDLASWEIAVDQGRVPVWRGMKLDCDDLVRADVIQRLMCQGEIDMATIENRYDIDFRNYFAASLQRLQALITDGLVILENGRIAATSRGRLLLRIIAMCFDRYLHQPGALVQPDGLAQGPQYSRVI